jgi:hypothetical protein
MAIKGPIALYSNVPIEPQFFQPWAFVVTAITRGVTTIVTMTIPAITTLNYVVGQQVRLMVPPQFGCRQLNGQTGYVLSIPSATQVEIGINSLNADPFVASTATTKPQIIAIGDNNTGPINAAGRSPTSTIIPGSFINISHN